jgi:hypothetical protein
MQARGAGLVLHAPIFGSLRQGFNRFVRAINLAVTANQCAFSPTRLESLCRLLLSEIRFALGSLKIQPTNYLEFTLELSFGLRTCIHLLENDMFLLRFLRSVIGFFPNLITFKRESLLFASIASDIKEQSNPVVGTLDRMEQAAARSEAIEKEATILVDLIAKHEVVRNLFTEAFFVPGQNSFDAEVIRLGIEWSEVAQIRQMLESLTFLQRELLWLLIQSAHKSGWRTDL